MRTHTSSRNSIILKKADKQETYTHYQVLTQEEGILQLLQRKSSKKNAHSADLFDLAEINIDFSSNGSAFTKEIRILKNFSGIAKNYSCLVNASEWSHFLLKNLPLHEAGEEIFSLTYNTFNALHSHEKSHSILFKSYYSFAKFEGYPVKEQWYEGLNNIEQKIVRNLISKKVQDIETEESLSKQINSKLKTWLGQESDLFL